MAEVRSGRSSSSELGAIEKAICSITQTMNALLVATDPGTPAPSSALDPNDERYRLVIQAIDTSFGQ